MNSNKSRYTQNNITCVYFHNLYCYYNLSPATIAVFVVLHLLPRSWRRVLVNPRKKEGEEGRYKYTELLVMYPCGTISNARTEHLCLHPGHTTYEIVNAASYFVSKVQAIYKKELHEELINFTYSPEHFFKWGLSHDCKFGGV